MNFREEYKKNAETLSPSDEALKRMKANVMAKVNEPQKKAVPFKKIYTFCGAAAACAVLCFAAVKIVPNMGANDLAVSSYAPAAEAFDNAADDIAYITDFGITADGEAETAQGAEVKNMTEPSAAIVESHEKPVAPFAPDYADDAGFAPEAESLAEEPVPFVPTKPLPSAEQTASDEQIVPAEVPEPIPPVDPNAPEGSAIVGAGENPVVEVTEGPVISTTDNYNEAEPAEYAEIELFDDVCIYNGVNYVLTNEMALLGDTTASVLCADYNGTIYQVEELSEGKIAVCYYNHDGNNTFIGVYK